MATSEALLSTLSLSLYHCFSARWVMGDDEDNHDGDAGMMYGHRQRANGAARGFLTCQGIISAIKNLNIAYLCVFMIQIKKYITYLGI